jgi:DNA-binding NtrC family response regulator
LSLPTQAKLLTLLEQQNFVPLGSRTMHPMHIDVRFISATNVPLHRASEDGSFRADLYHRLNGVTIELPPLRDREGDIELLARHYIEEFGRRIGKTGIALSAAALQRITDYQWPGNIRELQRVLSAAVVLADMEVTPSDLPDHVRTAGRVPRAQIPLDLGARPNVAPSPGHASLNLREIKEWAGREAQKRVILELQKRTNISRQDLARLLGVDPKTLRARLKEISADLE